VTLAVLPLSILAGAIRNLRAHVGDQVFLLHNRTRLMVVVAAIDAAVTVVLSAVCIRYWGLVGAAGATVLAALAATAVSFAIGFSQFGLRLPIRHLTRIGLATLAMAALLGQMPEASSPVILAAHIAAGATMYVAVLAAEYTPLLLRIFLRPRQSES
jgi:Na+-driven multidrug efflux pump